jgi:hypothetical protein
MGKGTQFVEVMPGRIILITDATTGAERRISIEL